MKCGVVKGRTVLLEY